MSESKAPVRTAQFDAKRSHASHVSDSRHESISPHSTTEDLYCDQNHTSCSPVDTVHDKRFTLSMSSSRMQHSANTSSARRPFISESSPKHFMRSSSQEELSNKRKNPENLIAKYKQDHPILNRDVNRLNDNNEFLIQRNCDERNNRTQPLFASNRLLPTHSGTCTNDNATSNDYYHIVFTAPTSQVMALGN